MPLVPGQVASAFGFGTSIGVAYPSNTTAGNLLIAAGCGHSAVTSFTATSQTPVTAVNNEDAANAIFTDISYVQNCTAAAVTWTRNHASDDATICIAEYSGVVTASALDKTDGTGQGFSTSPASGATASTAQANELLIGIAGFESSGSPAAASGSWTENVEAAGPRPCQISSQTVSSVGTYTMTSTLTANANWCASIATFKAGAGLPPPLAVSAAARIKKRVPLQQRLDD